MHFWRWKYTFSAVTLTEKCWKCMKNTQKKFLVMFEGFPNLGNTFGDVASSNCRENLDFLQKNLWESSEHAVEDVVVAFLWVLTNDSHLHKKSLMILEVKCLILQKQAPRLQDKQGGPFGEGTYILKLTLHPFKMNSSTFSRRYCSILAPSMVPSALKKISIYFPWNRKVSMAWFTLMLLFVHFCKI